MSLSASPKARYGWGRPPSARTGTPAPWTSCPRGLLSRRSGAGCASRRAARRNASRASSSHPSISSGRSTSTSFVGSSPPSRSQAAGFSTTGAPALVLRRCPSAAGVSGEVTTAPVHEDAGVQVPLRRPFEHLDAQSPRQGAVQQRLAVHPADHRSAVADHGVLLRRSRASWRARGRPRSAFPWPRRAARLCL